MDKAVTSPLTALETSFTHLLTALTTSPSFSAAPAATSSLLAADDALTAALATLRVHQNNYARILALRAEAEKLEIQIKDTVRVCGELRREVGGIYSGILDEEEDEDWEGVGDVKVLGGGGGGGGGVDYASVLSFARQIGRHNAAAAKEADEEAGRRRREGQLKRQNQSETSRTTTNGTAPPSATDASAATANAPPGASAAEGGGNASTEAQNIIPANEQQWLNETALTYRAIAGLPFPAAERLRMGELGQLQLVREQEGPEAVEGNIERRIAEAEGWTVVVTAHPSAQELDEGDVSGEMAMDVLPETRAPQTAAAGAGGMYLPSQQQNGGGVGAAARPGQSSSAAAAAQEKAKKPVKLDLDLWNDDSDEDEDD